LFGETTVCYCSRHVPWPLDYWFSVSHNGDGQSLLEKDTPMSTREIRYTFETADGKTDVFELSFDSDTMRLRYELPENLPEWAALTFKQCQGCPLDPEETPYCPLAVCLVNVVREVEHLLSFDTVRLLVRTPEREVVQTTTAQKGMRSLLGLIIATCGCPRTAFLRPMARFHLPLASSEETVYRATAMYTLAQYFRSREGYPVDLDLDILKRLYEDIQSLNMSLAQRLRGVTDSDSTLNAVVLLDLYAQALPVAIQDSLATLRRLFEPFLDETAPDPAPLAE